MILFKSKFLNTLRIRRILNNRLRHSYTFKKRLSLKDQVYLRGPIKNFEVT